MKVLLNLTVLSDSAVFVVLFQANRADVVTLDAGEVYSAVKQFGLVAIAKEIYSEGTLTTQQ